MTKRFMAGFALAFSLLAPAFCTAADVGLVDIKVCAVDETWSGLKLVLRRELR